MRGELRHILVVFVATLTMQGCAPKDVIPTTPQPVATSTPPAEETPPPNEEAEAPPPADPHAGHEQPAAGDAEARKREEIAAAEQAAYERAKPIFEKFCAKCHATSGKKATKKTLDHFTIDTYPFGGHHATTAGQTVREVLGVSGKRATMPKDDPGAVKDADLEAIVEWSKAFDASHAAGLHHHGDHDEHQHGHH